VIINILVDAVELVYKKGLEIGTSIVECPPCLISEKINSFDSDKLSNEFFKEEERKQKIKEANYQGYQDGLNQRNRFSK
jgi:hypothetical protein